MLKKRSKLLVAALLIGGAILVGVVPEVLKLSDGAVGNPLVPPPHTPSVRPIVKPVDDLAVLRKNALYTTGPLASVKCREPVFRPTSKAAIKSYYQALLVCMNKFWQPAVRKSGHVFHPPKLILFQNGDQTACGLQVDAAAYCDAGGGIVALPWKRLNEEYRENQALASMDMVDVLGIVYAVHVQRLTGIFDASLHRKAETADVEQRLEQSRQAALQANCLSAAFLGANKASFPLTGDRLTWWKWRTKHNIDQTNPLEARTHGSPQRIELWMSRGFAAPNPASCNTYTAPTTKAQPQPHPPSASAAASQAPAASSPNGFTAAHRMRPDAAASPEGGPALQRNALYRAGVVPAVSCPLPAGRLATRAALQAYAQKTLACLDRAWRPLVARSSARFWSPGLRSVEVGDSTNCGPVAGGTYLAFYCPADSTIYFNWMEHAEKAGDNRAYVQNAMIDTMAHEYGHHLQWMTGIGDAYDELYDRKSGPAQLDRSRRLEIQANCLAAAFVGANQKTLGLYGARLAEMILEEGAGDQSGPPDHGSELNNGAWSSAAFASKSPASCNTWAAPASKVS
ncbi:neutral zinc metallopeptidase [Kribbella sp. NPDC051620]|uniref:neutral zinc metallopeptidase n=1 Tax=Kribbella sp. NPDC051620 TaxID=3364120 RepID=UPI0037AB3750